MNTSKLEYRLVSNAGSFEIKKNGVCVFSAYQIEKCISWFKQNNVSNYYIGYVFNQPPEPIQ